MDQLQVGLLFIAQCSVGKVIASTLLGILPQNTIKKYVDQCTLYRYVTIGMDSYSKVVNIKNSLTSEHVMLALNRSDTFLIKKR